MFHCGTVSWHRCLKGFLIAHPAPTSTAERIHRATFLLFFFVAALNVALTATLRDHTATARWCEGALLGTAVVTSLVGLARRLPLQNVVTVGVLIAGLSFAILAVNVSQGRPFGPLAYSDKLGEKLFHTVPWPMPLLWVVLILNGRGVARLIMRPWRRTNYYGFWMIGLTGLLALIFDGGFEPFAVSTKWYWLWLETKSAWNSFPAPLSNYESWLVLPLFILFLVNPWLLDKKPVPERTDYYPLMIWGIIQLWVIAGHAAHAHWAALGFNLVANVLILTFALKSS